jgi:hypothetical protein
MSLSRLSRTNGSLKALHCYVKNSVDAQGKGRLRCLFVVTGGRASSFHDLSVGEALAPDLEDRENSGGGKFPSQISHRKDQHGSLGIEEKISQPSRKKC